MKATRIWLATALLPLAAACGGGEGTDGGTGETAATDTAAAAAAPAATTPPAAGATTTPSGTDHMALGGNKVSLQQVGGSGVSGEATLTAQGEETMVMVTLTNAPQGPHAGHIHQGTCENLGPPVAPLQEITIAQANGSGSSHSTAKVAMSAAMNGQHVISYHQNGTANPGPSIVCGSIPTEQVQPGAAGAAGGAGAQPAPTT